MLRYELKAMAKEQIKGNLGTFFGAGCFVLLLLCVQLIPVFGAIVFTIINPALFIGWINMFLKLINKNIKPKATDIFEGFNMFGKAFGVCFLIGLFTILWTMLLIVPGIIKSFAYSMAPYILAENPEMKVMDSIKESQRIMEGHKMELFLLYLSFFWWMLLCVFTLGIMYIYVYPYIQATIVNFYNSIKAEQSSESKLGLEF